MATGEHFDAIIVGTGFGGAVMAYRLAEAGKRVCVLERGKSYPPHGFPRSPLRMKTNFWDPSQGLQGMFDVWSFKNIGAIVSSGLGGGSLIYANVLLRKDEHWFVKEDLARGGYENWPVTRTDLEPHYDRAEKMLGANPFPLEHAPYSSTAKTLAFKHAAAVKGLHWFLPPLAVAFSNPGEAPRPGEPIREQYPNLHGRTRLTCTLCGECDIGCNTGSKNSLDYNYLSEAKRLGAEIRVRSEVRSLAPHTRGYEVSYVVHQPEAEGRPTETQSLPLQRVTATQLILSAGALGSTYLLLKNKHSLPGMNQDALGRRFSGNGDLLTLAWRSMQEERGMSVPRILDASHGPVITSAIRVADALDGESGRGFYIQDAAYPEFVNWMVQLAEAPASLSRVLKFAWEWLAHRFGLNKDSDLSAELSELFGDCAPSANSVPMLGMGRDRPDGRMALDGDGKYLTLDWSLDLQDDFFQRMRDTMRAVADGMGADFKDAATLLLRRVITVHPLGGCAMSDNPSAGVVNAYGEVHGHKGLYVADGSVMPGPVGPNPSLTIAALADRFADRLLAP